MVCSCEKGSHMLKESGVIFDLSIRRLAGGIGTYLHGTRKLEF